MGSLHINPPLLFDYQSRSTNHSSYAVLPSPLTKGFDREASSLWTALTQPMQAADSATAVYTSAPAQPSPLTPALVNDSWWTVSTALTEVGELVQAAADSLLGCVPGLWYPAGYVDVQWCACVLQHTTTLVFQGPGCGRHAGHCHVGDPPEGVSSFAASHGCCPNILANHACCPRYDCIRIQVAHELA